MKKILRKIDIMTLLPYNTYKSKKEENVIYAR